MRTGEESVSSLFERRDRLLAGHGREIVEELAQGITRLQVVQQTEVTRARETSRSGDSERPSPT